MDRKLVGLEHLAGIDACIVWLVVSPEKALCTKCRYINDLSVRILQCIWCTHKMCSLQSTKADWSVWDLIDSWNMGQDMGQDMGCFHRHGLCITPIVFSTVSFARHVWRNLAKSAYCGKGHSLILPAMNPWKGQCRFQNHEYSWPNRSAMWPLQPGFKFKPP